MANEDPAKAPEGTVTAEAYLAAQAALEREAREVLPFKTDKCTYDLGPLRQPVYWCKTCKVQAGICAGCSISCHGDHDLVELFPKRNFTCECPTSRLSSMYRCALHPSSVPPKPPVTTNSYNHNFEGRFCDCDQDYDPQECDENMYQCVVCEDWFHETCLNLRLPSPPNTNASSTSNADSAPEPASTSAPSPLTDDPDSDDEDAGPPLRLPRSRFESFVCSGCVLAPAHGVLRRWAGTPGMWVLETLQYEEDGVAITGEAEVKDGGIKGEKRKAEDGDAEDGGADGDGAPAKRVKVDEDPKGEQVEPSTSASAFASAPALDPEPSPPQTLCHAPPPHAATQALLVRLLASPPPRPPSASPRADLFLAPGSQVRWCRCAGCMPGFRGLEMLLEEEETWGPEPDEGDEEASEGGGDNPRSLHDLGLRALSALPRDQAINGLEAYNRMRDEVRAFLEPFAARGQTVGEDDVRRFFEERMELERSWDRNYSSSGDP